MFSKRPQSSWLLRESQIHKSQSQLEALESYDKSENFPITTLLNNIQEHAIAQNGIQMRKNVIKKQMKHAVGRKIKASFFANVTQAEDEHIQMESLPNEEYPVDNTKHSSEISYVYLKEDSVTQNNSVSFASSR